MIAIPRLQPNLNEPGLVLDLDFDRKMGNKIVDLSGHRNHGTLMNMDPATDYVAGPRPGMRALELDGSNDFVTMGNSKIFDITEGITLAVWAYITLDAAEPGLIGKLTMALSYGITFYSGDNRFYFYINAGGNNIRVSVSLSTWHHVVATYDRKTMRLYLNGVEVDTKAYSAAINTNSEAVVLGRNGTSYLGGKLSGGRVYSRALSAGEVRQIYEDPRAELMGSVELAGIL